MNHNEIQRDPADWQSLSLNAVSGGYFVQEAQGFRQEKMAEHALRLAGAFAMLLAILQWFLPDLWFQSGERVRWALTPIFMATGIGLYLFASRGFRREVYVDLANRYLILANVNSHNASMIRFRYDLRKVESLFVRRHSATAKASLRMRLKGRRRSLIVLSGERSELDGLHHRLCSDVHGAMECKPKRVQIGRPIACSRTPPWPHINPRRAARNSIS